jgi:hypothetical protein
MGSSTQITRPMPIRVAFAVQSAKHEVVLLLAMNRISPALAQLDVSSHRADHVRVAESTTATADIGKSEHVAHLLGSA